MGANDKTEATFHGQLPGVRYGVESAKLTRKTDQELINEARLEELAAAAEQEQPRTIRQRIRDAEAESADLPDTAIDFDPIKDGFEQDDSGKIWPAAVAGSPAVAGPEAVVFDPRPQRFSARTLSTGLAILIDQSGKNSRDHGFHDDWPVDVDLLNPGKDRDFQKAIIEKLGLQHEEISESLGEIRDGRDPLEIYFVDKKGLIGPKGAEYAQQAYGDFAEDGSVGAYILGPECPAHWTPLLKPEGFLVEQVDAVIRIADLAFLLNAKEAFIEALHAKHEYNATRPYKHGRQF